MRTWGAAYHEAGKAVARIHVGAVPVFEISCDDTAGALEQWHADSDDPQGAWRHVFVKMAGWCAEARGLHLSLSSSASLRHARAYRGAQTAIRWLAQNRYAIDEQTAWERCQHEITVFLNERWAEIERVARALLERGRLNVADIVAISGGKRSESGQNDLQF
jgi:hypothetical protein